MYPVLITLGRFTIRTYGVIVAIATITGIFVALHYAKTYQGIDEDSFLNFTVWTIIGGILGSRIFWILVSPGADFILKILNTSLQYGKEAYPLKVCLLVVL